MRRGSLGADPCQGGRNSPAGGEGKRRKRRRKDAIQASPAGAAAGALAGTAMLYLSAINVVSPSFTGK